VTLTELQDVLRALVEAGNTFTERDAVREYAMRWHDSEDEVARVRVDHDTRTVWLDH